MSAASSGQGPNPGLIFETFNMYQRSAALKAAIELDLFTEIAKGNGTAEALAGALGASTRGVRILADFLAIMGFLSKEGLEYSLSLEARLFLDKSSPAYFGGAARFILDPKLMAPFQDLAQIVRTGRTTLPDEGTVSYDNPIWVEFAEAMAPMQFGAALEIASIIDGTGEMSVLDIAAGHGLFGIAIAQRNQQARVTALDWAHVLEVATANAGKMGVAERHAALPGDAFTVDFGGPYDVCAGDQFLSSLRHADLRAADGENFRGAEAGRAMRHARFRAERRSGDATGGGFVRDDDAGVDCVGGCLYDDRVFEDVCGGGVWVVGGAWVDEVAGDFDC